MREGPTSPDLTGNSTGKVVPVDYYSGNFTFQVGAFIDKNNSERLKTKLDEKYQNAHIAIYDSGDRIYYRVRILT